jgi:hypothetical protein
MSLLHGGGVGDVREHATSVMQSGAMSETGNVT